MQSRGWQILKGLGITSTLGGILFYSFKQWQGRFPQKTIEAASGLRNDTKNSTALTLTPSTSYAKNFFTGLFVLYPFKFNSERFNLRIPVFYRLPFYTLKPPHAHIIMAREEEKRKREKQLENKKQISDETKPQKANTCTTIITFPMLPQFPMDKNKLEKTPIVDTQKKQEPVVAPQVKKEIKTESTPRRDDNNFLFKTPDYHKQKKIDLNKKSERPYATCCTIV